MTKCSKGTRVKRDDTPRIVPTETSKALETSAIASALEIDDDDLLSEDEIDNDDNTVAPPSVVAKALVLPQIVSLPITKNNAIDFLKSCDSIIHIDDNDNNNNNDNNDNVITDNIIALLSDDYKNAHVLVPLALSETMLALTLRLKLPSTHYDKRHINATNKKHQLQM